ncbi:MAG: hypothetical protein HY855_05305 [Burkholderiales bacterium]|nr:hypothetical protein [Burkholderiales bacterium]
MSKHYTHHVVAIGLAALMTLGVLGGLNGMADTQYQSAQQVAQLMCGAKA